MIVDLRDASPSDLDRMARALALARGETGPSDSALEDLRWRHFARPEGSLSVLAVNGARGILAGQSGLPVRVRLAGRDTRFLLLTDAFLVPAARSGLGNPGPFVRAARDLLERTGGSGADRAEVAYAVPSRRGHRVGKGCLGMEVVRNLNRLTARVDRLAPLPTTHRVEEVDDFPDEVDDLFRRAAEACGAIAHRDAAFLRWRFVERPGRRHRLALARRADGGLDGYAVWTEGELAGRSGGLVVDWLVAPESPGAGRALRAWVRDVARQAGVERVQLLLPEWTSEFAAFQDEGYRVAALRRFLVARSWSRQVDMLWLHQNWYVTLADLDPELG